MSTTSPWLTTAPRIWMDAPEWGDVGACVTRARQLVADERGGSAAEALARHPAGAVRAAIVGARWLEDETLVALAGDPDPVVRAALVAEAPWLPPGAVERLLDADVTPARLMERLWSEHGEGIPGGLVTYARLATGEVLDRVLDLWEVEAAVLEAASERGDLTARQWYRLTRHSLPPAALIRALAHRDPWVRLRAVAERDDATARRAVATALPAALANPPQEPEGDEDHVVRVALERHGQLIQTLSPAEGRRLALALLARPDRATREIGARLMHRLPGPTQGRSHWP